MDLSKDTLEEYLTFIEKKDYMINQWNPGKENTYILLYICDIMDIKIELTEISKSYLMEFIASQIDLINDEIEEPEENKDLLKKLEKIYEPKFRIYSYNIYKDSEINKTHLYILTGYILDKKLPDNDLFVKKIILSQLIKNHSDFYNILSLEELKKIDLTIKKNK